MTVEVIPIDDQLRAKGFVCADCKVPFEREDNYCRVGTGSSAVPAWCVCVGCACLRYFNLA